ncbi:MAG: hypothetical protein J1F04_04280 [Oscillospiraceae bacterium]|nr:hypothetical protein [Oscillospiraceae bacterium]
MFEEFFDKCEIQYPETVTAEQSEKIKASLRKMVGENSQTKKPAKEENIMKTKTIRTVIIAAAVAALGAVGVAGAASIVPLSGTTVPEDYSESDTQYDESDQNSMISMEYSLSDTERQQRQQIIKQLEEKNVVSEEYYEYAEEYITSFMPGALHSPTYDDMAEINELIVTEAKGVDYKGFMEEKGIILSHEEASGAGSSCMILPDGNGGYKHHKHDDDGGYELIEDEKLLAAIAEGTEKYGESFIIWY